MLNKKTIDGEYIAALLNLPPHLARDLQLASINHQALTAHEGEVT
tara:strand:- start:264 stop:398 length:135 start_codon:yes stop_codon:yes gene_type:complete